MISITTTTSLSNVNVDEMELINCVIKSGGRGWKGDCPRCDRMCAGFLCGSFSGTIGGVELQGLSTSYCKAF